MTDDLILVVEEDAASRATMCAALLAAGHAVSEAENGAGALRLAAEQAPALVLLDCTLPDADGFDIGRRLRALAPGLPVIAITGWAQACEERVLTTGFVDILVKPVQPSHLVRVVERAIGRAPGAHRPPRGRTILVVDDDPTQRRLAEAVLGGGGFSVTTAVDGEDALRQALLHAPDLILSDVLMPVMDGFALCKAVRHHPVLASVRVVLMSAHYLENDDRALGARFGASRYVSRSEGFGKVLKAIEAAMAEPLAEAPPADESHTEYLRRITHQLEHQTMLGVGLARRSSAQASSLSILDDLSDSLTAQLDPESALGDTLAKCLDAAGLTVGAILLRTGDIFTLKAESGSKRQIDWAAHTDLLLAAVGLDGLSVPSPEAGPAGDRLLLAAGVASAVVVPILARAQMLGVLLLASSSLDLARVEGEFAVHAARTVAMQLGQVLALSRTFSRLSLAERRYRLLLEHAHDGITISTTDGIVLEVNQRGQEIFGRPSEDIVGHRITEFAQGPDPATDAALLNGGLGSTPPMSLERPDGTTVQVEFSTTIVDIERERYVLSIGRDVSARLRLEEQLRQSQKMDAVGKLAGGIAHDFNNLLSVILSYAEILLEDEAPSVLVREGLQEIRRAGQRAADLTRQLLLFSRQQVSAPKIVDLNELITGVERMLQRILGADISLVSRLARPLGRVRVDPGSIEQVLMNLVVNARDSMPTGGKLTIETANIVLDDRYALAHGAKPGPSVMMAVTDTGVGMDKATVARIFEPFFTTKEVGKGTGLGLSTVFGIVEQSGGSVYVYSEPLHGSTFKVYLPSVDAALDVARSVEPPLDLRGTETILLVEDDDQVRAVARDILHKNGYQVLAASSASEAIARSEAHPGHIDLLLTDVVMPEMSGPALAKRLTAVRPSMKVLCMSGYTDDSVVRHGVLSTHMAYLQKPLTPMALATKLREVLGER